MAGHVTMLVTYLPEIEKDLLALVERLKGQWETAHARPGQVLWHYTTAAGLQGILRSNKLRATNVFYMNDTQEVRYAQRLMVEELERKKGAYTDPLDEFLEKAVIGVGITEQVFQPHVSCFCGEGSGDLLSQWRAYANMGGGYALGFVPASLASHGPAMQLRKVVYDDPAQRRLIGEAVDEFCKLLRSLYGSVSSPSPKRHRAIGNFTHALAQIFQEYVYCFKHPSFAEEQEWRLVQRVVPYQTADESLVTVKHVNFRESRGLLVPYVELDLAEQDAEDTKQRLPLSQINIGPSLRQDLAENSLKQLLNKLGYNEAHKVRIERSEIPLA